MQQYRKLMNLSNNMWITIFDDPPAFVVKSPTLAQLYYDRVIETGMLRRKPVVSKRRALVTPENLVGKEKKFYEALLKEHDIDAQIMRLNESKNVSGRILDSLVTKFPKVSDVTYYVSNGTFYQTKPDNVNCIEVNLADSYTSHIKDYSKSCFDPFGRGHDILHTTKSGQKIPFSLCRFMFHRWAEKYCVYQFLNLHFEEVALLQRKDQQRLRMAKRKAPDA